MTEFIATRTFASHPPEKPQGSFVLKIGAPENRGDEHFWYTSVVIEEDGNVIEDHPVFGPGDSLSSLIQAIWFAGIRIRAYQALPECALTWLGVEDLGLPRPPMPEPGQV